MRTCNELLGLLALTPASYPPHRPVRLLRVAAGGEGFAEGAEHLAGLPRSDREGISLRDAEHVERGADVVVGVQRLGLLARDARPGRRPRPLSGYARAPLRHG